MKTQLKDWRIWAGFIGALLAAGLAYFGLVNEAQIVEQMIDTITGSGDGQP